MIRATLILAAACVVSGCSERSTALDLGPSTSALRASAASNASGAVEGRARSPIKHVVFVVQENRSFNNLFMGYPGATTAKYGYDRYGHKIALQPISLTAQWDIDHSFAAFVTACDGQGKLPGTDCKMDGWNGETLDGINPPKNAPYGYVPRNEIKPYWTMAKRYVLADDTFASNLDGSFTAHQYAVAAFADHTVNVPATDWGCEGGKTDTTATLTPKRLKGRRIVTCFGFPTIASEADAAGVSWRFYAPAIADFGGIWSSYQADRPIYDGPDWATDVVNPPSQFITDVGNGTLADVTWITPTYATSDHPGFNSKEGPAWVASVVDAVGQSKFWNSTAIFVLWDDWGGWFDPVKPVYEDYDGLGFRIPLIVISPYAKEGSVTHVQYETASVLRFIEDTVGLGQLATSDARANDPAADPTTFDFKQKPRAFQAIPGAQPPAYWREVERRFASHADSIRMIGDD
jgi:phospholipase C